MSERSCIVHQREQVMAACHRFTAFLVEFAVHPTQRTASLCTMFGFILGPALPEWADEAPALRQNSIETSTVFTENAL